MARPRTAETIPCSRGRTQEEQRRFNESSHAAWLERNPGKKSKAQKATWSLRTKYNLSLEMYERMANEQGWSCAICHKQNPSGRRLAVDHDHVTGAIRSLLCQTCNTGLGSFQEDPELMMAAIKYLQAHRKNVAA